MSKRDCFKALGIKSLSDEFESSVVDGMTDEEIRDLGTKIALNYYNKLDKDLVKLKKSVGLKVKESPIVYEPPKRSEKLTQQSSNINEEVLDKEYEDFVNTGAVSEERLDSISKKVTDGVELTEREQAILADKTGEINQKIEDYAKEQKSGDVQGDKEARTQPSDVDELTDLTEFEKSLTDEEGRSIEEEEGASKESVSDPEIGVKSPPSKPAT